MNAHANSSGIVDIKTDIFHAFYVEADLSYSYSPSFQNSSASDTARMMISTVVKLWLLNIAFNSAIMIARHIAATL